MKIGIPKLMKPILMAMFILITMGMMAQSITITGKVTSGDDSSVIPGVNVIIKGSTVGTVTNFDGNYELKVNTGDVISFSFIGFLSEEITVSATQSNYNLSMTPDLVDMDEVVVIGYGTQKKSDLTGAVSTVSGAELNRKPVVSIEQAMQGLTAGVTVTSNSGAPGEGAKIRIRGVGTVNNTDPLYVIDGVPVGGSGSTNPADIESISVLKDAAACAIYGARGANGVVVITTKKGKKGFHLNFDSQFGLQKEWKRMDLLNSEQYSKYINEAHWNKHITDGRRYAPPSVAADPYNQEYDTDWQDEMFQLAPMQRYNLGVSGGNDWGNYNVSGGYTNQQGIMISTGYEKFYARANSEAKFGRFRIGETFAFNSSDKNNEKNMVGGRNQIERMLKMTPNIPVYDTSQVGGYAGPTGENGHDAVNPVGVANMYKNTTKTNGFLGNIYAEAEIIEGLTYKLSFGFDFYNSQNRTYVPENTMGDSHGVGTQAWDTTFKDNKYTLIENLLSYDKTIDKHHINAIAGYTQERNNYEQYQNKSTYNSKSDESTYTEGTKNTYESGLVSYLGRVNYSYADKYLFQANIRRDGSSKFGEENRWGVFPSYSAGWVISKEQFLKSQYILSFLKLRGSYGTIGNQNIGDYGYEASLGIYQRYTYNDVLVDGVGPNGFENPYLQWETSTQSNVGADIGLLDNRINITAEYYNNVTEDMLIPVTMPLSNGSSNFPYQNAGSVRNRGFELMLNYRKSEGAFNYSITGNITTIDNEVLDLGVSDDPLYGGSIEISESSTKTVIGQSIGSFYGYVTDGIYTSADQIDPVFAPFANVGDIRFKDLNEDGVLDQDDRDFIGSPIPKFTYGFNFSADYKNFDVSVSLQGVYGNDLLRETKYWTEGMVSNFNASTDVLDRYRPQDITITTVDANGNDVNVDYAANTNTSMPWAFTTDPNNNAKRFSDRYIEDGSYLRLKDMTIGYTLPKTVIERLKLGSARVYVSGLNLLTFTNYSGYDPEIGGDNLSRGIDNGYYPQATAYLFGIQIGF